MAKAKRAETERRSGTGERKGNARRESAAAPKPQRRVKEIAGVKVPKDFRELAAAAQKLAENPLVRDVVSAGIMAAMAAIAEAQQETRERKAQRAAGGPGGAEGERQANVKSTAKIIASAAAGAMSKRIVSEVKTRGPELLAKLEGVAKLGGGDSAKADYKPDDDHDNAEQSLPVEATR